MTKKCNICGIGKSPTDFLKTGCVCKSCSKIRSQKYYLDNKEKIKADRLERYHRTKVLKGRGTVWNKGRKIQTNTGKTHFKKGMTPWNKGIITNPTKYVNRGGVWIHRKVMEEVLCRKLLTEEQIHHIDYDKGNNNPENLFLCPDQKFHVLIHRKKLATRQECKDFKYEYYNSINNPIDFQSKID